MVSSRLQFCSADSTNSGESPIGSAWYTPELIVCELPLPWGAEVLKSRNTPAGLETVINDAYERRGYDWGLIGCAPDEAYSVSGYRRVMHCTIAPQSRGRFERRVFLVPNDDLTAAVEALLHHKIHPSMQEQEDNLRDVLLCTHGAVDACCAKFGYPLYALMRKMADNAGSDVRVWRSTHFGGHRFAPTYLELPSGRYWGRITPQSVSALVHRRADEEAVRPFYRGSATMATPVEQAIEAELFYKLGWNLDAADLIDLSVHELSPGNWRALASIQFSTGERIECEIDCRETGTVSLKAHCNYDIVIDASQFESHLQVANLTT